MITISLNMKKLSAFKYILLIIYLLGIIGEIRCIYKAINCNWEPIGKAEIIYTVSAATGAGLVVGWFNIEDK